jgi:hypothetical protein
MENSCVHIKFAFRSKPKVFYMENEDACRAVCELLSELLQGDEAPHLHTPAHAPLDVSSDEFRLFSGSTGADADELDELHSAPDAPEWWHSIMGHCATREVSELSYARLMSGWCCRVFVMEALLFGVLMPLALAGYWMRDSTELVEETGQTTASGEDRWLLASCNLRSLLVLPRQVYHHGKYADAKDLAYQDGLAWRLEPAWNTSVSLLEPHPDGAWGHFPWEAITHTTATESLRPHCDGQVLEELRDVRHNCMPLHDWVDRRFLVLNWTAHECWVDRFEQSHVYLDVDEPLYFYVRSHPHTLKTLVPVASILTLAVRMCRNRAI